MTFRLFSLVSYEHDERPVHDANTLELTEIVSIKRQCYHITDDNIAKIQNGRSLSKLPWPNICPQVPSF